MLQLREGTGSQAALTAVAAETPSTLIADVLNDAAGYCDELSRFAGTTAGCFRAGDDGRALTGLVDLISGLGWLTKALDGATHAMRLDFGTVVQGNRTLREQVEILNALLTEILATQERKDWVLLTDLLDYELAPLLAEWRGTFCHLRDRVA